MLFSYSFPSFEDFKNSMAVTPIGGNQLNTGSAYFEPGKLIISFSLTWLLENGPISSCQPLLKPGLTKLISSYIVGPFSVSHKVPVIGSKAIPKLFLIPYA